MSENVFFEIYGWPKGRRSRRLIRETNKQVFFSRSSIVSVDRTSKTDWDWLYEREAVKHYIGIAVDSTRALRLRRIESRFVDCSALSLYEVVLLIHLEYPTLRPLKSSTEKSTPWTRIVCLTSTFTTDLPASGVSIHGKDNCGWANETRSYSSRTFIWEAIEVFKGILSGKNVWNVAR